MKRQSQRTVLALMVSIQGGFPFPISFLLLKSSKMKLISVPEWNNSPYGSKVYKVKGYLSSRVTRYPNSASTFQISRLIISEHISENPGPSTNKLICPECSRAIAKNHRSLTCSVSDLTYHIKCEKRNTKGLQVNSQNRTNDLEMLYLPA